MSRDTYFQEELKSYGRRLAYFYAYTFLVLHCCYIWDKEFKKGPSKICGRKTFKNLKGHMVCFR